MSKPDKQLLDFLKELSRNNNREWFSENKPVFEKLKSSYEVFIQGVIDELASEELILKGLEAKSCIFRLNRDTRFSHDKTPYKTNFGAFIVRGGRKNGDRYPGYYIHIEPGKSMIAGGAYMPPSPWLGSIRRKIDEYPEEYLKIISDKRFTKFFGGVDGEKLKSAPKGFEKDHPMIEHLKFKSYTVLRYLSDKEVLADSFRDTALESCRVMRPFNSFLNCLD